MSKSLIALPFVALALMAAKPSWEPIAAAPTASLIAPPTVAADPANRLNIQLSNGGTVVIQLRPDLAPNHVRRIQTLVSTGFYNGTTFHRVVPGFMAQGGDPKGTGQGGSTLPDLKAEFNTLPFLRGTFGAARADSKDSANSQFFIMLGPNATLNNNYTVMGRVVEGMTAVDAIAPGEPPAEPTKIVRASLGG
jgi:cyclophilin family peptidyl-prolyl cis-trans isomerase